MTRRFLAIGECMVEMAPRGDGFYAMGFAGDTFNTAWYARRVAGDNWDVAFLSAVGDDEPSRQMAGFMQEAGIRPLLRQRAGRSVGLYLITLTDGERSFSYWRGMSAARTLADDLDTLPDLKAGDLAYFSGISLAILPEAGRERLLSALGQARDAGVTVAFDPNLRPRLWDNVSEMCDWTMKGAATAGIALPSFEDEAAYFGDADTAATAARYRAAGVGLCVVKDGGRAVLIVSDAGSDTVPVTPADRVVDTTAAGDSFNAQFLISLADGESARDAAARACALSRRVIGAPGALVAL